MNAEELESKQGELKIDIARTFYEQSSISNFISWLELPESVMEYFLLQAGFLIHRLASEGVCICEEGELPESRYYKEMRNPNAEITGFFSVERETQQDMLNLGFKKTYPLESE
jgi:hypothetical protein